MSVSTLRKRLLPNLIDRNNIYPCMVRLFRYSPFTPHSTLAESINRFSVPLSLSFTWLGKNNLSSDLVYILPALSFIRLIECLFTARHAVCALNYFSLPDTANSYFLLKGSNSIRDFVFRFGIFIDFSKEMDIIECINGKWKLIFVGREIEKFGRWSISLLFSLLPLTWYEYIMYREVCQLF